MLDCDDARATQFEDLQEIVDSVAEADVEQLQFAKQFNKTVEPYYEIFATTKYENGSRKNIRIYRRK